MKQLSEDLPSTRNKTLAVLLALCFLLSAAFTLTPARQKIIGAVRVFGSEPHTYAAIQDEKDGSVYLIDDSGMEQELRAMQGKRVEFTVKITRTKQSYPPADGSVTVASYKEL
jgi:hypothetical protein